MASLTFIEGDGITLIKSGDDEIVGRIEFDLTGMTHVYTPTGQVEAKRGTYAECVRAAEEAAEFNALPEFPVVEKGPKVGAFDFANRYGNSGAVQKITIAGDGWQDSVWVPLGVADKLRVGSLVKAVRPNAPWVNCS